MFVSARNDVRRASNFFLDKHSQKRQDRYGVMTRVYYKDAHAAIVVMDATRDQSREGACRWKADLDQKLILADGSHVPAVLVVNKHSNALFLNPLARALVHYALQAPTGGLLL
ncbi:unnamed protein product [Heligmosomoides polygyrus]|uniref:PAS domain-containing protein n=1 Tax=Heligmosomoides polygyrus TaxID=6339 RepID=A0A183GLD9_HELPZ|nr:unnamed protein product [Heligmosomoides polygyrus]